MFPGVSLLCVSNSTSYVLYIVLPAYMLLLTDTVILANWKTSIQMAKKFLMVWKFKVCKTLPVVSILYEVHTLL